MSKSEDWEIFNPSGKDRILVTKMLPGKDWLEILLSMDLRVEVNIQQETTKSEILKKIGANCKAVIGQLTEEWDLEMFEKLAEAGGKGYCNYAVGFDNVDLKAASKFSIAVGNTPDVLTETTAEMALGLTLACARRIVEADSFIRNGHFKGWLPDLLLGQRLWRNTVGIIGAGRIGSAYALMMVQAFQMNLIYFSNKRNLKLENNIKYFNAFLRKTNCTPVEFKMASSLKEVIKESNVISLHIPLNEKTKHLIAADQLALMKKDAILINTSRGPIIDEEALAAFCSINKEFKAGLDVFEKEPDYSPGMKDLPNVTITPHIASATKWTREGMAKLAALNIKGILGNYPVWSSDNMTPFLEQDPPEAIPSIINQKSININT